MKAVCGIAVVLLVFTISCRQESDPVGQGSLNVQFNVQSPDNGRAESQVPSTIFLSIQDSDGQLVFDLEELTLVSINGGYVTSQIPLETGQYTVEAFIVADDAGEAIYLSPIEGSELAPLVNQPLPVSFEIAVDETTDIVIEVIDASIGDPIEFGYATFSFDVVNTLEIGLLAHYPLDGDAEDVSGNGFDGTVNGATTAKDRFDNPDAAYRFDGVDDFVDTNIEDVDLEGLEAVSFGCWVKFISFPNGRNEIISNTDDRNGLIMSRLGQTNKFNAGIGTDVDNGEEHWYKVLFGEAEEGQWYHLMTVYDGEELKYFIDGVISSSVEVTGNLERTYFATTDYTVKLGGNGSLRSDSFLNGVLDDVRIYDRALTDREVYQLATE